MAITIEIIQAPDLSQQQIKLICKPLDTCHQSKMAESFIRDIKKIQLCALAKDDGNIIGSVQ